MERIVAWYRALSAREQILVGIAAVLLVLLIGIYGIVNPLMTGIDNARAAHAEAAVREGRIAAKLDALQGEAAPAEQAVTGPLDQFVRQEAAEMGLVADDVQGSGENAVTFNFRQVTAPTLFGWLASLERRGIIVVDVSTRPAAGSALSARMTLRRP